MSDLATWLTRSLPDVAGLADELRRLDSVAGDGDLGITVTAGVAACLDALEQLEDTSPPSAVIRACGTAFNQANPSTFSALIGYGAAAAAAALEGATTVDNQAGIAALDAALHAIARRGKAQVGEKTVVDALAASLAAVREHDHHNDLLSRAADAAELATAHTAGMTPTHGRAAWAANRSLGSPDGGARAYTGLLVALLAHRTTPCA